MTNQEKNLDKEISKEIKEQYDLRSKLLILILIFFTIFAHYTNRNFEIMNAKINQLTYDSHKLKEIKKINEFLIYELKNRNS